MDSSRRGLVCGVWGDTAWVTLLAASLTHFLNAAALFEVGDPDAGAARSAPTLRFGLPRLLVHHRLHFPHLLRDGVAGCIGIQAYETPPAQVLFNVRSRTGGFMACEKRSESEEGAGRVQGWVSDDGFPATEWKSEPTYKYGEGGGMRRRASEAKQYVRVKTIGGGQARNHTTHTCNRTTYEARRTEGR